MNYPWCKGETTKKTVTRQHWLHERLYIVENVEAEVCLECGERYFHASTLDAIDRLIESDHAVEDEMVVEVIRM